jgi:V/A-type H+-transporting ATPase subunit E
MALEGILEKIGKIAEEKVGAIEEESRLKRQEIVSRAESQAREIRERILKEASQKAQQERRQASVSAELEYRKEILKERRKLMEDCFQAALEELLHLPTEKYRALVGKMLLKTVVSGEESIVISPEDQKRIDPKFVDAVNDELRRAGKKGQLQLEGTSPRLRGGFVLRTEDTEMDCSFGSLLDQLKDELQAEVAGILFGDKE